MIRKIRYNSPVILTFTIISFVAFVANIITGGISNRILFSVYRSSLYDFLFYIRLVGHVFGHANWEHFSGNIIMLLLVGPLVEEKYGSFTVAIVMFITAVVTGIINSVFFSTAMLGGSGIVFALIMLSSLTCIKGEGIPLTFVFVAVFYFGHEIYSGVFVDDNIANLAHISGGVIGCLFGVFMKPRLGVYKNIQ